MRSTRTTEIFFNLSRRKAQRSRLLCSCITCVACFVSLPHQAASQTSPDTAPVEVRDVEEIVVVGTDQSRYVIDSTTSATSLPLDFLESPRSISLLPEQLFLDRKITSLQEALRNAPGVLAGDGFGGTRDDFYIRGFQRNNTYRDGFRRATSFNTNLSNLERVEVIRGPAALTFGQVSPGGVVNNVAKRPLEERRIAGELRAGRFDDYFGLVDYSQPITDDLGVRVVGSVQDSSSFREFTNIQRNSFALSVRYDVTPNTQLDFAYEYRTDQRPMDRGTFAVTTPEGFGIVNDLLDIPIGRRFGNPFESFDLNFNYLEAGVKHDFSEDWSLQVVLAGEISNANDSQARLRNFLIADGDDARISDDGFIADGVDGAALVSELRGGVFDDPTDRVFLLQRADGTQGRKRNAFHANFRLNGEFETGSLVHRVAIGGDFRTQDGTRQFVVGESSDGVNLPFFNIVDGDYLLDGTLVAFGPTSTLSEEDFRDYGLYASSYTDLTDRLSILLGLRYSNTTADNTFGANLTQTRADGIQLQGGLTYEVTSDTSVYASYAESFQPNNVIPIGGTEFRSVDPETGEQFEVGIKAEFFDGKLQAQAALYSIDLSNVFSGSDADFNPIFVEGQSSRGVELTLTGQPMPGMNLTANYAYVDAEISGGNRPNSIPEHTANAWVSYEFQNQSKLQGLGLGLGAFYESNRFGNNANTFELGTIFLVDASVWYTVPATVFDTFGNIRFQLALKNAFNDEYLLGTVRPTQIPPGAPRSLFGSVSFDF